MFRSDRGATCVPPLASDAGNVFEWRAPTARFRWLLLSSLGMPATYGCGGQAYADGVDVSTGSGGQGGTRGAGASPGLGGTPGASLGGSASTPVAQGGAAGTAAVMTANLVCRSSTSQSGGWDLCSDGVLQRKQAGTCASELPRPQPIDPARYADALEAYRLRAEAGEADVILECQQDSDCTAAPNGYCVVVEFSLPTCRYGCVRDADCGQDAVCVCGDPVGECSSASCRSDSDCAAGLGCTMYESAQCGGGYPLSCQTRADECRSDGDCSPGFVCHREPDGRRGCGPIQSCPIIGRPFLVAGEQRSAPAISRRDWRGECAILGASALDAEARAALAQHWTEQGLLEHASVAAFARFTLQLLSLGAPAELVTASARAMQDEIRHAQGCFGLAARYSGSDVGPGPLALQGALEQADLWSVVQGTILEGCIGETVAAVEAAEAFAHCDDAEACALLERIAAEEAQHAELAWRFVAWALAQAPSLAERVRALFARELEGGVMARCEPSASERCLLRHGVLAEPLRRGSRQRVLAEVIAPCAARLARAPGSAAPERCTPATPA
jgi:hypothetical protein